MQKASLSLSVHFELYGKIVLNCWHYTGDEFQKEEQAIFNARFSSILRNLVDHFLHHSRVVARMNTELIAG